MIEFGTIMTQCKMSTTSGVKAAGAWLYPRSLSSAKVKEKVLLYLSSLWAFMACFREKFTFITAYMRD